jgi:flavin-dependent dehydrogenase
MSDEAEKAFTPTTEQVRYGYAMDPEGEYRDPIGYPAYERGLRRAFDRWLAARIREAKAEAWDEGLTAGADRWMDSREFGDPPVNPYRSGTTTEGNRDE